MAALDYLMSFAGVPFLLDTADVFRLDLPGTDGPARPAAGPPQRQYQPLPDLIDELNRLIDMGRIQEFGRRREIPSRNLAAVAKRFPDGDIPDPRSTKINEFCYPTGACRWSVFRGLMTTDMVQAVLAATGANQTGTFVMEAIPAGPPQATGYTVSTNLYLLPPRQLGEADDTVQGLYLVTLVDERYYWQGRYLSLHPTASTTWSSVVARLADVLGVGISMPGIGAAYSSPEPDSQLWTSAENAAVLLDAVAANLGCAVVRDYDGTYSLVQPWTARATVNANRGPAPQVVRFAGGDLLRSGGTGRDRTTAMNAVLPASIDFSFPKYVLGDPVPHFVNQRYQAPRDTAWYEDSYGDTYVLSVPLLSGSLQFSGGITISGTVVSGSPASGLVGLSGWTPRIRSTAKALYSGEAFAASGLPPLNASGLASMAMELAGQTYAWQVATALDEVYPGILDWVPDGMHDLVFTYSARSMQASTRVMRLQWNQAVSDFQHAAPPLSGQSVVPAGVGGKTVPQAWRDSYSGTISTTLSQTFTSGDSFAALSDVSYLPTQNRWKARFSSGQADDEIMVLEGTSGGINNNQVVVVRQGEDGTLPSDHANGASVIYVSPDATYAPNLITAEKGQWIYQGAWRSGGVQEAVLVPQIQTVRALNNVGVLIHGIKHYSGQVALYDTTQDKYQNLEYVWLVERNSLPINNNTDYDGQFVGYNTNVVSAAGPGSTTTTPFAVGCQTTTTAGPTTTTLPPAIAPVYLVSECCATTTTPVPTATSTTYPPCTGTCRWTYTLSNGWQLFSDSCCTNCVCLNPTYCGTSNGECTQTGCISGVSPPMPVCTTTTAGPVTTTTTCNPNTTTSTGTISPTCTTCTWYWNGLQWVILSNGCGGGPTNCVCPPPTFLPGSGTSPGCQEATLPCVTSTTPPPSACSGFCTWIWVEPTPGGPGQWALNQSNCTCGPCAAICSCQPPSFAAVTCGTVSQTPCLYQSGTTPAPTSTSQPPCGAIGSTTTSTTPSCGGSCTYQWTGSAWSLTSNGCLGSDSTCGCVQPFYNGQAACETASVPCASGQGTTTTGTTSTTGTTQAPCGSCTYVSSNGVNWTSVTNNCTGGCACAPPPEPTPPPGISQATVSCVTTTTTSAPCTGSCTYVATGCSGHLVWILSTNSCTGTGCGCCNYGGSNLGGQCPTATAVGQLCQSSCVNTSSGLPCPATTTTDSPPGNCSWIAGGYTSTGQPIWYLCTMGCAQGYQCQPPTDLATSCCTQYEWTACVTTTTTSTTTTAAGTTTTATPRCGDCVWIWTGSVWKLIAFGCSGTCGCGAPSGTGTFVGQQQGTICI